jgi:DNA-binding transcriptional LysR family regulator
MRDLHVFFDVVQSGSMAKAAAQLRVKQPSVSDRSPQGIRPRIYGDALIECGVAVFDQLKQGIGKIEFLSDPTTAEVRIGCVPSMAATLLPSVHPPICVG